MDLYIVRHGESQGNIGNIDLIDPELTDKGKNQAILLGKKMSEFQFDAIFSSPLVRAVQTAKEIAVRQKNSETKVQLFPDLFETGTEVGFYGKSFDELCKVYPNLIISSYPTVTGGSGYAESETSEDTYKRAVRVINYIKNRFNDNNKVVLVAHGSFNNFLISAAIGIDYKCDFNFSQDNTCLSLIKYIFDDNNKPYTKASYINDTSHLENIMR